MLRKSSPSTPGAFEVDGERMTELASIAATSGELDDDLVEMFYRVAHSRLHRYRRSKQPCWKFLLQRLSHADLIQEGVLHCCSVVSSFDPTKGSAYSFFYTSVGRLFITLLNKHSRQKRVPPESVLDIEEVLNGDGEPTYCRRVEYLQLRSDEQERQEDRRKEKARKARERDQQIRERHAEGATAAELSKEFNVHPSTISRALKDRKEAS